MTNLTNIRLKTRRITALPSTNQLSVAELDQYINTFYQYDLPEHLRLINLKETFSFITEPDIDIYNFTPNTNVSIEPPVYAGGFEIQLYQDRKTYFDVFPETQANVDLDTGDGTAGPYAGTVTATPIKRNRVLISTVDVNGNPLSAVDSTAGTFTGDVVAGSTINYTTGAIAAVTFTANIALGTVIRIQSINYQSARPQGILFYDDQFQLTPVPDQAYEIVMNTFITPTALVNGGDEPELREWWQLIAYGAALKIFADNLDMESHQKVMPLFDEQKRLMERRTLQQLKLNRVKTIYSQDIRFPVPYSSGS